MLRKIDILGVFFLGLGIFNLLATLVISLLSHLVGGEFSGVEVNWLRIIAYFVASIACYISANNASQTSSEKKPEAPTA